MIVSFSRMRTKKHLYKKYNSKKKEQIIFFLKREKNWKKRFIAGSNFDKNEAELLESALFRDVSKPTRIVHYLTIGIHQIKLWERCRNCQLLKILQFVKLRVQVTHTHSLSPFFKFTSFYWWTLQFFFKAQILLHEKFQMRTHTHRFLSVWRRAQQVCVFFGHNTNKIQT